MKRKSRARRNPFPSDPSMPNVPNMDLEVDYTWEPWRPDGTGRRRFDGFRFGELMNGDFIVQFDFRSYWFEPESNRWKTADEGARYRIPRNTTLFIYHSAKYLMLRADNESVEVSVLRKSSVRPNPFAQDPSRTDAPPVQLEVARLVGEYGRGEYERGDIGGIKDLRIQLSSFELRIRFSHGWFFWDQGWVMEERWQSFQLGETVIAFVPRSHTPDGYYMVESDEYRVRVYELKVVK